MLRILPLEDLIPPGQDLKFFVLFKKLIPQPLLFKKEKGRT
ncbi:hypothetical protein Cabys_1312 [Caldithrix abyssi DSM 13497]|uniref:Uncharacterized protein n=1 Tax=Caldithrix abyssi DSM 13497 TaxID=880073 RepID=A0A1J1C5U9_CALAY|nr:hypothetical protein Cabys_1312 [Caldithrix abyssi DSM 13497]